MTYSKNHDLKIIFSTNLKYYRIENNMTQSELAEKVNLSIKFISDLERAIFSPSIDTLAEIAKALNTESYLFLKYDKNHENVPNRLDLKTGNRKKKIKIN